MRRQKSRQVWCRLGNRNTRFFHLVANFRRAKNHILKVVHNGSVVEGLPVIKDATVSFFSNLFRSPDRFRIGLGPVGFKTLSASSSASLERDITLEELKQSVWDCDGSKSPGPDGFNFKFYRLAWNFIADDLLDLANNFFKTGRLPKGVNHAYVHLIPKTASQAGFKDFRPISLIHDIYKIMAKVLSSRLKAVMHDLISENQTAFLARRQIIDGFLVANEAVHSLKRCRVPSLIFKVDFHKAFDTVQWDYLEQVMRHMGFGEKWINLIKICISTAKLSVLINGSPSKEFLMGRGIRQGDPLSLFLFLIVVEGLSVLFQRATTNDLFKGITFGDIFCLSHLQYADDTLIFMPANLHMVKTVKRILLWFAIFSGLHINFHKSSLIGINVGEDTCVSMASSVFYRFDSLRCSYLGMPLGSNPRRLSTWKPIIKNFRRKLSMWRGGILSMAGHICRIKSVLSSLPVYYMSSFLMLKGFCNILTSIQRRFLWSGVAK
jgi:hypothetical protein